MDNRVYQIAEGGEPKPITLGAFKSVYYRCNYSTIRIDNKNYRYAKLNVHPKHTHLLVAVLEDHTKPLPPDVVTTICIIDSKTQSVTTIVSGADFYAFPSFSPDGTHLAWEQWSHPDMPWEGSEVYIADVDVRDDRVSLSNIAYVAGKKIDISVSSPTWVSDDVLLFTTDETGYHNPWTYSVTSGKAKPVLPSPVDEDFTQPLHRLGNEYSAPLDLHAGRAIYSTLKNGGIAMYIVTLSTGDLEEIDCPYTDVQDLKRVSDNSFVFLASRADAPQSLIVCVLAAGGKSEFRELKAASADGVAKFPASLISVAQAMTLTTEDGEPLHVLYLPPKNPAYEAPAGERPPCVVNSHGGPTGHVSASLDWSKQYFTSRGWAWYVMLSEVRQIEAAHGRLYSGLTSTTEEAPAMAASTCKFRVSASRGACSVRFTRKRLEGKWGVVDVEDCTRAMQQLSAKPYSLIDPKRSVIRGGSAGGYTTLAIICFKPDAFAAATSLFGIADLRSLAKETHKFESHYLEKLMGGTLEEIPDVYEARSPVFHADKIKTPLLVRHLWTP